MSLTAPVSTIHSALGRARHGMTAAPHQQDFDRNLSDGFRLVHVDAYGSGADARFATI